MPKIQKMTPEESAQQDANVQRARELAARAVAQLEQKRAAAAEKRGD